MLEIDPSSKVEGLFGGVQIENSIIGQPGTLGGVFKIGNTRLGITAAHVLMGSDLNVQEGDIVQPSIFSDHQKLNSITTHLPLSRELDYICYETELPVNDKQSLNGIPGIVRNYAKIKSGLKVKMFGVTSHLTRGIVGKPKGTKQNQFLIHETGGSQTTDGGDSGSIWVLDDESEELTVIGLNVRSIGSAAVATDFKLILEDLSNRYQIQVPLQEKMLNQDLLS